MKSIPLLLRNMATVLLFSALCGGAAAQSAFIYHIGVGQGDATLIILTNKAGYKTSILIDAGNSKGKGDTVFSVCNTYLSDVKRIDYVIVSHLHSDHLGGMAQVFTKITNNGWQVGYIIDRVAGGLSGVDDVLCYDNGSGEEISNDDVPAVPASQQISTYKAAVSNVTRIGWINIPPGFDILNQIPVSKGYPSEISFRSLTSNGFVCTTVADYNAWLNFQSEAHNENDYSYSFLLELGQFKYFTGGDIGGAKPYVDLETPLVDFFNTREDSKTFHFCGYKATHHGSPNSTNTAFVNFTRPTVTVVPSALRSFSGTQLPGKETLDRIESSSTNRVIYYTYGWTGGSTAWSGKVDRYRDVLLRVDAAAFAQNHIITINTVDRYKNLTIIPSTDAQTTFTCQKHTTLLKAAAIPPGAFVKKPPVKKAFKKKYSRKRKKLRNKKMYRHGKYA